MNTLALFLLGLAVVNPARTRVLLGARSASKRSAATALGAVVAVAIAGMLAAVATPLIEAMDVAPETFRIAAAMIITLSGIITIAAPLSAAEAMSGDRRDALIPVAYPILLGPAPVLAWLVVGVDEGVWTTLAVAAGGYVASAAVAGFPTGRRSGWVAAARLIAAIAVVLGVALVIDGVREV